MIHLKQVPDSSLIKETHHVQTVGANGTPVGQTTLIVGLGTFQAEQEFIVARCLSVDCLLGADFLTKHYAVINFKRNALKLDGREELRFHCQLTLVGYVMRSLTRQLKYLLEL